MRWVKKGLIYCPNNDSDWQCDTFMTPQAMLMSDNIIRIWGGVRDKDGVSRIKYIDVSAENPKEILYVSNVPSLDIGNDGCFDDNGVILGAVIPVKDKLHMYYVGFQHVQKVKFVAFSGLAISNDNGMSFKRYAEVPIFDRTNTGRYGRCVHDVFWDENKKCFVCYYTIINDWKYINNIPYPVYNIWYAESQDGIHFSACDNTLCVDTKDDEYRIGRPKVYKTSEGYEMFYTRDTIHKEYKMGYAVSQDGIHWERRDMELQGLEKSDSGWDSEMTCYPVRLDAKGKSYMFYSGNGMGKTGVGYAELEND